MNAGVGGALAAGYGARAACRTPRTSRPAAVSARRLGVDEVVACDDHLVVAIVLGEVDRSSARRWVRDDHREGGERLLTGRVDIPAAEQPIEGRVLDLEAVDRAGGIRGCRCVASVGSNI